MTTADLNIRKHSSRMRTARLPTIDDFVATTKCQYWWGWVGMGTGYRSHVLGECIAPIPYSPFGPISYPPLDLYHTPRTYILPHGPISYSQAYTLLPFSTYILPIDPYPTPHGQND